MKKLLFFALCALCCTACLDSDDVVENEPIYFPRFFGELTVTPIVPGTPGNPDDTEGGDQSEGDDETGGTEEEAVTPAEADTDADTETGEEEGENPGGSQGPFGAFHESDVIMQMLPMNPNYSTIDLFIPKIKFVEQMPVYVSFILKDLQNESNNPLRFEASKESTFPYWNGEEYKPDGSDAYLITNLHLTYSKEDAEEIYLKVEFDCRGMHVNYYGLWDHDSMEF